ncbi:MAG: DNA-3-methyladenine glycosylase [Paenibacillaceae bacterium]|nr:DNA-3-methyladenine glycosylase [Paenibacillaceae bacterium]
MNRLNRSFFEKETTQVAKRLLGCILVRRYGAVEARAVITETEAYTGEEDPASHAFRGITPRNRIMFADAGHLYVYLSYGIHYCMNVVTETAGIPGAVLLRAAVPVSGHDWFNENRPKAPAAQWMNGPGKLARAFSIDLAFNGLDLTDPAQQEFMVLEGEPVACRETERVGISKGKELLWRYTAVLPQ